MTDREQVRRDAEESIATRDRKADRLARHCLALLAELEQAEKACNICGREWPNHHENCAYVATARDLEQADKQRYARLARLAHVERERDEATDAWQLEIKRALAAEARLAKVPALVEALRTITADLETNAELGAPEYLHRALTDWEQT